MIIHVASDLHLDMLRTSDRNVFRSRFRNRDHSRAQALVLAGDVASLCDNDVHILKEALDEFCQYYPKVFYVSGNHEMWGTSIPRGLYLLKELEANLDGFVVLRAGEVHELEPGLTIGGDTLWYPDCEDELLKRYWCDYSYISGSEEIHFQHQKFLDQAELPDVVVTHHFPTYESIAPEWRGNPNNCFFHSQMEDWLLDRKDKSLKTPKIWIHGHSHNPMDYVSQFGFRAYSNPRGYKSENEMNPDFFDRMEIDIKP
jgi:hypothetical protein